MATARMAVPIRVRLMKAYNASMSTRELTMTMTRINGTLSPKILNVSVGMRFSG